jgi:transposase
MEVLTPATWKDLDMSDATFCSPDLTTFARLDGLGLVVIGQQVVARRAVLECRVVPVVGDEFCRQCGAQGVVRDTVTRRLAHEPLGWRATTLVIRVRRFRCPACRNVWRQDTTAAAEPRAKVSRGALAWALEGIVVNFMSMARVAAGLGVSWHTANDAVLAEGQRRLISDPTRFTGVNVIGVDEHKWSHTWGDQHEQFVTVIIDLTPVRDGTGPSRLLDMIPGRSKLVFENWLESRPHAWRDGVEVVAMDGFTGFKTAATAQVPDAVTVMDPFHVVRLAGDAVTVCRQRVQQQVHGRRGRKDDPLYRCRSILLKGVDLLTDKQAARLNTLFADERYAEVEATWGIYQKTILAYRAKDKTFGHWYLEQVIDTIQTGIPAALVEVKKLADTLTKRRADVLAFFDHPGTSNGPTEAINGRLEYLRGIALGFRNITNYVARSLLHSGGFRPKFQPSPTL